MRTALLLSVVTFIGACSSLGLPKQVEPVNEFELDRYLGQWHEIARLDNWFERGLSNITATYSLRDDGGVVVANRGYSEKKSKWQDSVGKAYFVGDKNTGHLKVSFFGPFYASYAVFELDKENYQYAYVSGNSTKNLWFLSRTPTVSEESMERFKSRAAEAGFDVSKLILVDQSPRN